MSTACSVIIDRARSFNPLNASLASDPVEMLTRIGQQQTRIFSAIAGVSKDRFQTSATLTSSAGASGRTLNLASLTTPLERILTLTLPDGREAHQVDILDIDAEYAPRYFARGQTLIEVGNDWSGTSSALACTLVYVIAPTTISPTGGLAQTISLPDEWADLLIKPLAAYLHTKDPGREPLEYDRLNTEYQTDWSAFIEHLTHYAGRVVRTADIPAPSLPTKR